MMRKPISASSVYWANVRISSTSPANTPSADHRIIRAA